MNQTAWLAEQFEEHRAHLRSVAYRMLGSTSDADDAVQEAWIRLSRTEPDTVQNLGGWLTTVVARVSLDMLRTRRSRHEESLDTPVPRSIAVGAEGLDPEHEAVMADSVGLALLVVLEKLTPAERLAFVLHDMFAVPFDDIAPIVGRSPAAARQLASRARRRVQGATTGTSRDLDRQREIVTAFLAASRNGDFQALVSLLDPDVVLRADESAVQIGASIELRGAQAVAQSFAGRASAARLALLDGSVGAVWAPGGRPRVAFRFTLRDGKVTGIDLVADAADLSRLEVMFLEG
jgi:RNA polymerase sigma-70 factor (ECF subfamily)